MKLMKVNFFVLVALGLFFGSCGNGNASTAGDQESEAATEQMSADHDHDHDHAQEAAEGEKQGKEYTSAYVCPMHCKGSGSEEPGQCPVCGMDYVVRTDHEADGHSHQDM